MPDAAPNYRTFIHSKTVEDLLSTTNELIDLSEFSTVEEAFDILITNDISSFPVYTPGKTPKIYHAMIDIAALADFTLMQPTLRLENGSEVLLSSDFLVQPLRDVIECLPKSTKLHTVSLNDSLPSLLNLMTYRRIHRVLVDIDPPRLVSQMDVMRYLFRNNHMLGRILDMPANSVVNYALKLNGGLSNLETEHEQWRNNLLAHPVVADVYTTAWSAFARMRQEKVGAIALVSKCNHNIPGEVDRLGGERGEVVAELSLEKLRGLNRNRVGDLFRPVMMFLEFSQGDNLPMPLFCREGFTLSQIMGGMMRQGAHHAWVVDANDAPMGCVSLSDILSVFVE
ncbi:uncharacterized protein VTP21DRAFT_5794 [Calcarisporiella thermophila]|uniref:uncharacterized protein n=1 Tax=Calcarisporiella thermophila TaxID=911321 RepID=UPI0037425E3A